MALEPADKVLGKSNEDRLKDIHWDIRGPGQVVQKFGEGAAVIGGTTLAIELGWLATNFARIARQLDSQSALIEQLAVKQGVTIDYAAIAKAVVDEEAKRLSAPTIAAPEGK